MFHKLILWYHFLSKKRLNPITSDPDGNLWFTENLVNEIGKISPKTGSITEYVVPTNNAYPIDITRRPNGNLWFTEQLGKKIGEISPSTGIITEYNFPDNVADPIGIVAAPDSNLWSLTRMKSVKYLPQQVSLLICQYTACQAFP
jgi:streptogramin lyase